MKKLLHRPFLSDFLALLVIFAFALVAMRSLIVSPFYTSHDGFTHTARIAAYYDTLKDGQFPPRWAKNLNGTLGSPIFTYSYNAVYFIGSLLHTQKVSYEDAFRIIMLGGYLLSGVFAYFWLKNKFGLYPSLIGTMAYLWTPYRFLDIYVRGALAENLAFAFLPIILLAIDKLFAKSHKNTWFVILTLSTSMMLLSHNVVSAMFLPIAVGWGVVQWIQKRNNTALLVMVFSLIFSFAISGFIYAPDLFERNFIRFDQGISYYSDHFVAFKQLIYSAWGYGFDLPGWINDGLSFQLGLANILMLAVLAAFLTIQIVKNKKDFFQKKEIELGFLILVLLIIVLLVVQNPLSLPIWNNAPVLKTIVDFPWRFLGIIPIIFGFLFAYLVQKTKLIGYGLGIMFLVAILVANRNYLRVNEIVTYGDNAYDNYTGTSTASSNEYTPMWRNNQKFPLNAPRVSELNGISEFKVISNTDSELKFTISSTQSAVVRVNRFYFPNTRIYKNGQELTKDKDWSIIMERTTLDTPNTFDDTGLIKLNVDPPGATYSLRFSETPLRSFANILSEVSFLALMLFSVLLLARKYVKK